MKKFYFTSCISLVVLALASINLASAQENCPEKLIHLWTLNNNDGGTFKDQVGNLDATTLVATETVEGMIESAQYFNGLSELVIPDNADFDWSANANFTFEFWVKKSTTCTAQTVSSNNVIIGRDDSTSNLHWWIGISCSNPGKVNFTLMSNDGKGHTLESKRGIIDGNWHLVSVVREGSSNSSSIFIDGQLDTTSTFTFSDNFASLVPLSVGWINLKPKYHLDASIDEIAYYMSAIDDSVFAAHFNSGIGKAYCENVVIIDTTYSIAVDFENMDPHIGKSFAGYLKNADDHFSVDSVIINSISNASFNVVFNDLTIARNYNVDFWTDMNSNGKYDNPPEDHAWRLELGNVDKDTVVVFTFNTDFTDIFGNDTTTTDTTSIDTLNYQLTINFTGFSENVGQQIVIYLHDPENKQVIDSIIESIDSGDFVVVFDSVVCSNIYNVDFYTDVNGNGSYDIPPVDEAWRIEIISGIVDTTIVFVYDTVYTDIGIIAVGIDHDAVEKGFSIYPNPVSDKLYINLIKEANEISIHGISGVLLAKKSITNYEKLVHMDISALNPGMYIIRLRTKTGFEQQKFLKE